jgi:hypothetical protein
LLQPLNTLFASGEVDMRRLMVAVLTLLGLVGLILFLSFEINSEQGYSSFRMGQPDAWIVWDEDLNGHKYAVTFTRWSFGIGILALVCLYYSVRLAWPRTK